MKFFFYDAVLDLSGMLFQSKDTLRFIMYNVIILDNVCFITNIVKLPVIFCFSAAICFNIVCITENQSPGGLF